MTATAGRWDLPALRAGGGIALVFALPFAILARILADGDGHSSWSAPLYLASLAGFFVGAGVAAWHQRCRTPLSHGLAAAVGTYVMAQGVVVIANILLDRSVRWLAIAFTLTLVSGVGLLGGLAGLALQRSGLKPNE